MLDETIDAIVISKVGSDVICRVISKDYPETKKLENCKSMSDVLNRLTKIRTTESK